VEDSGGAQAAFPKVESAFLNDWKRLGFPGNRLARF